MNQWQSCWQIAVPPARAPDLDKKKTKTKAKIKKYQFSLKATQLLTHSAGESDQIKSMEMMIKGKKEDNRSQQISRTGPLPSTHPQRKLTPSLCRHLFAPSH